MPTKTAVIKEYFSTSDKPVTARELIDFKKADPDGFDEIARLAAIELGVTID